MIVFGGNTHNDTSHSFGAKCYSNELLAYDVLCDSWHHLSIPHHLRESKSPFLSHQVGAFVSLTEGLQVMANRSGDRPKANHVRVLERSIWAVVKTEGVGRQITSYIRTYELLICDFFRLMVSVN